MKKTLLRGLENYLTIVKRFIPQQEEKPLVGLDIGVDSCKMVELKKKGASYELLNWAIEPIISGDVKRVVKSVLTKLSNPNISPATSVNGKGCLIRFIELPRMSPEDMRRSFSYESDKYFPFPRDQIYMDFYILDEITKDNKMNVLIAAVKKEIVDDRMKLLSELGLQSNMISLNSIAIANAIHVLGLKDDHPATEKDKGMKAIAILNLEELLSSVTILVDNRPRFNRDIFIGGRDFTKCISRTLQVTMEEAERLKTNPGEKKEAVLQACDSALQDIVSELRLSFDYFVTDKNIPLSQLLLTGTASSLTGLRDVLTRHMEMAVKTWNPIESLTLGPQVAVQEVNDQADKLGVAIGLALYG
jgi:type IV pilus assembly protein PilM